MSADPKTVSAGASEFDNFAEDYEAALNQGLSLSGEGKDYFAGARISFLKKLLENSGDLPARILDYGCGTGSATPHLLDILKPQTIVGVDLSAKSIELAQKNHGQHARFSTLDAYRPDGSIDLAFCNGVFHHIPLDQRPIAARYVHQSLRPGGLFAFWENNPWNPGTQLVMSRIPFDRDAVKLSAPTSRRLLMKAGFQILRTDFLFIFPRSLGWFRPLEQALSRLPLGAQYQVLCKKMA